MVNIIKGESPSNWRSPHIEYLIFNKVTSDNLTNEEQNCITNRSQFFAITNGKLMRKFVTNGIPKECLPKNYMRKTLKELHRDHQMRR